MLSESWFQTTGQAHMRDFCQSIERAYARGKASGLPLNVDMDEVFRCFRPQGELIDRSKSKFNGHSKLSIDDIREIRRLIESGTKYTEISNRYNISGSYISDIRHRKAFAMV
jgi:hypothetical protein